MGRIVGGIEKRRDVSSKLIPVFITCDPVRDTPETIKQYLQGTFHDFLQIFITVLLVLLAQQRMSLECASNLEYISNVVLPVKLIRMTRAIILLIILCFSI